MDLINLLVSVVAANPHGALVVSAVPVVQAIAYALAGVLGWLGKIRGKGPALPTVGKVATQIAAFPIKVPAPVVTEPRAGEGAP